MQWYFTLFKLVLKSKKKTLFEKTITNSRIEVLQDQPDTIMKIVAGKLPAYFTSFIGRNHELAEIKRLLEENSLLTLTGTGGVGKTRLAVQFARTALAEGYFQDEIGIGFVELALLNDERYL